MRKGLVCGWVRMYIHKCMYGHMYTCMCGFVDGRMSACVCHVHGMQARSDIDDLDAEDLYGAYY